MACLAALLALAAASLAQGCLLALDIDAAASPWALQASVVSPLPLSVDVSASGVQGRLLLSSAGACPITASEAAASTWALVAPPPGLASPSLRVWPKRVKALVSGIADLSIDGMELQLTSPAAALPALGTPLTGLTAGITGGVLTGEANGSPTAYQLPRVTAPATGTVSFAAAGGVLTWTFQDLTAQFTLTSGGASVCSGTCTAQSLNTRPRLLPLGSELLLTLTGGIVATTKLGCNVFCGYNGRCAGAPGEVAACVCDCGWGGPGCGTPTGFCPVPLSYLLAGATAAIPFADAPAALAVTATDCGPGATFDAATGSCSTVRRLRAVLRAHPLRPSPRSPRSARRASGGRRATSAPRWAAMRRARRRSLAW